MSAAALLAPAPAPAGAPPAPEYYPEEDEELESAEDDERSCRGRESDDGPSSRRLCSPRRGWDGCGKGWGCLGAGRGNFWALGVGWRGRPEESGSRRFPRPVFGKGEPLRTWLQTVNAEKGLKELLSEHVGPFKVLLVSSQLSPFELQLFTGWSESRHSLGLLSTPRFLVPERI